MQLLQRGTKPRGADDHQRHGQSNGSDGGRFSQSDRSFHEQYRCDCAGKSYYRELHGSERFTGADDDLRADRYQLRRSYTIDDGHGCGPDSPVWQD
jgi:hypothetical protein